MKKIFMLVAAVAVLGFVAAGCGGGESASGDEKPKDTQDEGK